MSRESSLSHVWRAYTYHLSTSTLPFTSCVDNNFGVLQRLSVNLTFIQPIPSPESCHQSSYSGQFGIQYLGWTGLLLYYFGRLKVPPELLKRSAISFS